MRLRSGSPTSSEAVRGQGTSALQRGRRGPEAQLRPSTALGSESAVAARLEGLPALGFVVGLVVAQTLSSSAACNLQPPFGRSTGAAPAMESGPSVCSERVWPRVALGCAQPSSEAHVRAGTTLLPRSGPGGPALCRLAGPLHHPRAAHLGRAPGLPANRVKCKPVAFRKSYSSTQTCAW